MKTVNFREHTRKHYTAHINYLEVSKREGVKVGEGGNGIRVGRMRKKGSASLDTNKNSRRKQKGGTFGNGEQATKNLKDVVCPQMGGDDKAE